MNLGKWTIEQASNGIYAISDTDTQITFEACVPKIVDANNQTLKMTSFKAGRHQFWYEFENQVELTLSFSASSKTGALLVSTKVVNHSSNNLAIARIIPCYCQQIFSQVPMNRLLANGKDMCGFSSLHSSPDSYDSNSVLGLTDTNGTVACVFGFCNLADAFYNFNVQLTLDGIREITAFCDYEGIAIKPDQSIQVSALQINTGNELSSLMRQYAQQVASVMGAIVSKLSATGWCSWYYYYDQLQQSDLLENVEALKKSSVADKVQYVQIDDGWSLPTKDHPRIWGDWLPGDLFASGMKDVADRIKGKGFLPGLWLAPFSVDKASCLFREHPEWLIQGPDGPQEYYGVYGLDLSHPQALEFVRQTFERVFNEWGYEYIKIDFLLHAVIPGKRYDDTRTTAQCLRNGLKVIREVAGDRFILCCGCPVGPAVGLCDGMRVGYDVSSRWDLRVNTDSWPEGNLNIRVSLLQAAWRHWMHQKWWQNDPDCLVLRDYGSTPEKDFFENAFPEFAEKPPYGLSDEEAQCWSQFVWLTGGMAVISENMTEFSGPRLDLLQHNFPPNTNPVEWVNWYPDRQIIILQTVENPKMIGMFNLSENPVNVKMPSKKLILEDHWAFRERLSDEIFLGQGDCIEFPELPSHAGRIWIENEK